MNLKSYHILVLLITKMFGAALLLVGLPLLVYPANAAVRIWSTSGFYLLALLFSTLRFTMIWTRTDLSELRILIRHLSECKGFLYQYTRSFVPIELCAQPLVNLTIQLLTATCFIFKESANISS